MAAMGETRIAVSAEELASLAAQVRRAADEIGELKDRQGTLHGRAQDGGDAVFASAVGDFADRWMWGIEVIGSDVDILADALLKAAAVYTQVEGDVSQSFLSGLRGRR